MRGQNRKRRMNLADVFLILLAVLSVSGILLRLWRIRQAEGMNLREYAVETEWRDVDLRTVACLREGETLYTAAGEAFGTVLAMERTPCETEVIADGTVYRVVSETRCNVRIRLSVACRESDGQLLRGDGSALTVGQTLRLYSSLAELPLKVVLLSRDPIF